MPLLLLPPPPPSPSPNSLSFVIKIYLTLVFANIHLSSGLIKLPTNLTELHCQQQVHCGFDSHNFSFWNLPPMHSI